MNEIEQYFVKKCEQYNVPAPKFGEKNEVALEKIRGLIEYLEAELSEANDHYWS